MPDTRAGVPLTPTDVANLRLPAVASPAVAESLRRSHPGFRVICQGCGRDHTYVERVPSTRSVLPVPEVSLVCYECGARTLVTP
jgi:hypothetical protein